MRTIKRAMISVSKRLGKSGLLLLVITTVMTLVLSSMAIQGAVLQASEKAQDQIDAKVKISLDYSKMMGASEDAFSGINDDYVTQIKSSSYAKNVKVKLQNYAITTAKQYTDPKEKVMDGGNYVMNSDGQQVSMPTNIVIGMDKIENSIEFGSGNYQLKSGVLPYESDAENPVAISKELAEANSYKLGSTFKYEVENAKKEKITLTATVVGIYEVTRVKKQQFYMPLDDERNTLFTTYDTVKKLIQTASSANTPIVYEEVEVELEHGTDIPAFINEMKTKTEGKESTKYIKYSSDLDKIEKQTAAIQKVANISQIIIWLSGVAAILILSLLMLISLRDRTYEVGILLSLGETRFNMMLQVVLEVVIIAALAFVLSFGTSSLVAEKLGDFLVSSEVKNVEKDETATANSNQTIVYDSNVQEEKVAVMDRIDVKLAEKDVLIKSYGLGLGIILFSSIVPMIWMMRKNPKNIMLRKE